MDYNDKCFKIGQWELKPSEKFTKTHKVLFNIFIFTLFIKCEIYTQH